jgi:hypothetical protein
MVVLEKLPKSRKTSIFRVFRTPAWRHNRELFPRNSIRPARGDRLASWAEAFDRLGGHPGMGGRNDLQHRPFRRAFVPGEKRGLGASNRSGERNRDGDKADEGNCVVRFHEFPAFPRQCRGPLV